MDSLKNLQLPDESKKIAKDTFCKNIGDVCDKTCEKCKNLIKNIYVI